MFLKGKAFTVLKAARLVSLRDQRMIGPLLLISVAYHDLMSTGSSNVAFMLEIC